MVCGLVVGLLRADLFAAIPSETSQLECLEIMMPGGVHGVMLGWVTQRYEGISNLAIGEGSQSEHSGEIMVDLDKAVATQLANIQKKTGRSLAQLTAEIATCGKAKHGEIRTWLMATYGIGYGDANALALHALKLNGPGQPSEPGASTKDALCDIYSGKKAHLRLIHDKLMEEIHRFGVFEIAPKKGYISLRRKKQFAMLGPKTNDRFELGLNLKEEPSDPRLMALPPGGMCQFIVPIRTPEEVDTTLVAIIRRAYDASV